jgi:hypothetical protein
VLVACVDEDELWLDDEETLAVRAKAGLVVVSMSPTMKTPAVNFLIGIFIK